MTADLTVVTIGRISADVYPEQVGVSIPDVRTFRKSLGARRRTSPWPPPAWASAPPW